MIDQRFWARYFSVYDALNHLPAYVDLLDSVCRGLEPKAGALVLDAGSGTGNLTLKLKQMGCRVISLDFCAQALERHISKDAEACVLLGDLEAPLPFKNDCFDGVVCNNVLYSLPMDTRLQAVKEFRRVLKPRGKVAISNPAVSWNPLVLFSRSIVRHVRSQGAWQTARKLARFAFPTIRLFFYNGQIRAYRSFRYFEIDEQRSLLMAAGYCSISETARVYDDQALLNVAFKNELEDFI